MSIKRTTDQKEQNNNTRNRNSLSKRWANKLKETRVAKAGRMAFMRGSENLKYGQWTKEEFLKDPHE